MEPTWQLPDELTRFSAQVEGNNILLNWSIATEVNNYGFEVERTPLSPPLVRRDADSAEWGWVKIGFVQGNGNSNSPKNYEFTDACPFGKNPPTGNLKYRLKQIDNDGQFKYSDVVNVPSRLAELPEKYELFQNYPNPFNPKSSIKYQIVNTAHVNLVVYDVLGREVMVLVNEVQHPGYYEVKFDAGRFASGIYFYRINAGEYSSVRKMILAK